MSNAPLPSPPAPQAPSPLDYEHIPSTGVRKVLDAYEERDLQRIRWGAVIAGLFLAIGTEVLLGLLGLSIGLSTVSPRAPDPLRSLAMGTGIWMGFSSLVALFVGSYGAAKLGGSIRRADGALSGVLTWAVLLVITFLVVGSNLSAMLGIATGRITSGALPSDTHGEETLPAPPGEERPTVIVTGGELARAAWSSFGGVFISLLAAVAGGALGAVGARQTGEEPGRPGEERDTLY